MPSKNQIKISPPDDVMEEIDLRRGKKPAASLALELIREALAARPPLDTVKDAAHHRDTWRRVRERWQEITGYTGRDFAPAIKASVNRCLKDGLTEEDLYGVMRVAPTLDFVRRQMDSGKIKGYMPLPQILTANMLAILVPMIDDVSIEAGSFDINEYREILIEEIEAAFPDPSNVDRMDGVEEAYNSTTKEKLDMIRKQWLG